MRIIVHTILLLTLFSLSSCKEDIKGVIWGETEYYTNFFGYDYEPVVMEKTLELDFNEDAKRLISKPIKFEIVELKGDNYIPAKDIKVYKNGQLCNGNEFDISTSDTEVTIGVEFLPTAEEGYHTVFFREKDSAGLDRIEYTEIGSGIVMNNIHIMNPLAFYLMWAIIILGVAYILWYLLVILPKPRVNSIELDYSESGYKRIKMNGSYELVCTSDRKRKDGFFRKMFCGTRKFEYDDFWTHEVTISPRSSRATSAIKVMPLKGFEIVGENMRKEPFEVVNADGSKKVTITTS